MLRRPTRSKRKDTLLTYTTHVRVITEGGHVQAREPGPTAGAATAMFYGIELTDTKVAELADVAPVAASTLLMFRAQPTIDPVDMRQNVSYFSAKPNARSVQALRSEEYTSELQTLMRISYAGI